MSKDSASGNAANVRSFNDIAQDIVTAAPSVEPLVEEWFVTLTDRRVKIEDDLRGRLGRIRAAAESDADLAGTALRDFLLRETEAI